jgi:S-adenosylmethionine uptake transporter
MCRAGRCSLPVLAAACYAGMQVLTRKLGARSAASAMAIYIQGAFILVSLWLLGRCRGRALCRRTWARPAGVPAARLGLAGAGDLWVFGVLGCLSAMIGYALSQAYRLGTASVVASYEYVALPLAIFWGWLIFGEVPRAAVWIGTALIAAAGLWVFARERARTGRWPPTGVRSGGVRGWRPCAGEWGAKNREFDVRGRLTTARPRNTPADTPGDRRL